MKIFYTAYVNYKSDFTPNHKKINLPIEWNIFILIVITIVVIINWLITKNK